MFELKGAEGGQGLGKIIMLLKMLMQIRNQVQMIGLGEILKSRKMEDIIK